MVSCDEALLIFAFCSKMNCIDCSYISLCYRLPIFHDGATDSSTFKDVLRKGIVRHAKELQNAKALVDGKMVSQSLGR